MDEKAKLVGIKKPNKERINPANGRKLPSWFAVNWRDMAAYQLLYSRHHYIFSEGS